MRERTWNGKEDDQDHQPVEEEVHQPGHKPRVRKDQGLGEDAPDLDHQPAEEEGHQLDHQKD